MNIMPKHEGQATVASFDSQYWQLGESEEIAAPQFGQLRVCAFIGGAHASSRAVYGHLARRMQLNIVTSVGTTKKSLVTNLLRSSKLFHFVSSVDRELLDSESIVCDS